MKKYSKVISLFVMFALLYSAWRVYGIIPLPSAIEHEDIYYSYVEGQRILNGENPYERVLDGDMRRNDKYATYFPLFYELSSVTQILGLDDIGTWILFWRRVFIACNLGTAVLLFYLFERSNMRWVGVFSAAFWLFNRWTLTVVSILHLDFMPIFFLVASLAVFPKKRWLGLLLYGVSLALKQIGIFVLPLYLVWTWFAVEKDRGRELFRALLLIGCVPLLASIPFLIWNAEGFVMSILFSVTRAGAGSLSALSLDEVLKWKGVAARLPMFILFAWIYWLCFARYIGRYTGALLAMAVFVAFNTALFPQYFLWLIPLMPLVLLDSKETYSMTNIGD